MYRIMDLVMNSNIIFGYKSRATETQVSDSRTLSENRLNTRPTILDIKFGALNIKTFG